MADRQLELAVAIPPAELHHLVHCDEDGALCGDEVRGQAWRPGLPVTCPVCASVRVCPDCDVPLGVSGG